MAKLELSKRVLYGILIGIGWAVIYFGASSLALLVGAQVSFLTALDGIIPLVSWSVWVYASFIIGLILIPFIISDREAFFRTAKSMTFAVMISVVLYILFPSLYPRPPIESVDTSSWLLSTIYSIDPANNTFPSLHVSLSFLVAYAVYRDHNKYVGMALIVWATMIAVSTLLTKQHFIADVFGGFAVSLLSRYLATRKDLFTKIREKARSLVAKIFSKK